MVLVLLSIESLEQFFDESAIKVIKYFLSKSIFAQPEILEGQSDLPIQVPKELFEKHSSWYENNIQPMPPSRIIDWNFPQEIIF